VHKREKFKKKGKETITTIIMVTMKKIVIIIIIIIIGLYGRQESFQIFFYVLLTVYLDISV